MGNSNGAGQASGATEQGPKTPRAAALGERRGLNPQPPEPQSGVPPIELRPPKSGGENTEPAEWKQIPGLRARAGLAFVLELGAETSRLRQRYAASAAAGRLDAQRGVA